MKSFAICILLVALGYAAFRYVNQHQQGPELTASTGPRLAPEGTYFLLDYHGVHTDHGVTGWTPGQKVKAVAAANNDPGKRWVTDGSVKAELEESMLTRDIDLADGLRSSDSATQAEANRLAAVAKEQTAANARKQQASVRTSAPAPVAVVSRAPSNNPLDRPTTATNGGRQVSSAPVLPDRIYLPQAAPSPSHR